MKDRTQKEFHRSLDIIDKELEKHIPGILEGLWELGSMPEYMIDLMDTHIKSNFFTVTDFGCGKGAVLIQLAEKFDFEGLGIDMVPEFIASAKKYAREHDVDHSLEFMCGNFVSILPTIKNQDLVIYGYESDILGDLKTTLHQLRTCVKDNGYMMIEYIFLDNSQKGKIDGLTEKELLRVIKESNCKLIGRRDWDRERVKGVNRSNNALIRQNVASLIEKYPENANLFENYFRNQLEECDALENFFTCTTMLLRKTL
ncbi:class I SAM-dependent methyltransferase [Negadavirga shengliensis]|uniref:Class I SAM-dependent methyltransferase n=1 Tax=Negadavirga shengliensis TaxID=1389218 RepID=A0ABV9SXY4_9BACT